LYRIIIFSVSNDNTDRLLIYNVALDCCVDSYYQNVRCLRTKYVNFCGSISSMDFKIICLTETRLMDYVFSRHVFPCNYKLFRADRVYAGRWSANRDLLICFWRKAQNRFRIDQ
jgi:hypothetical protein